MVFPTLVATGLTQTSSGSKLPTSNPTSPGLNVKSGESIYVWIGYDATSTGAISVASVQDSLGNVYSKAGRIQNLAPTSAPFPAIEVWYFDNITGTSALTITVNFTGGSTYFTIIACQVSGTTPYLSLDVISSGSTGIGLSSSDPITTLDPNDLVIAFQCQGDGTGTLSSGGGFTHPSSPTFFGDSGSPPPEITLSGWILDATAPSVQNSSLGWPSGGSEAYAILTVAIRTQTRWSNLAGNADITVSPIGTLTGTSLIENGGADFGPDTPGTETSGIQEAMNFASAQGFSAIRLLPGVFTIAAQIVWPAKWSGMMQGSGSSINSGSMTLESNGTVLTTNPARFPTPDSMLVLSPPPYSVNTSQVKIRDIYFYFNPPSGSTANAVVDLTQLTDERHQTIIERCDFDGTLMTTSGFVCLIMDNNQGSILFEVSCWAKVPGSMSGAPIGIGLRWHTPGGGVKCVGGTYVGMDLHAQAIGLYSVTTNSQITISGGANVSMNLYDCYKNPTDNAPVVLNSSGNTLNLSVYGGRFYVSNPGSGSTTFFDSSAAADNYNLVVVGAVLIGANASANPNSLLNATIPGLTSQLIQYSGVVLLQYAQLNVLQSSSGLGTPVILGVDNRTGLTAADGGAVSIATAPAYNGVFRLSVAILETAVTTPSGTMTYEVTWKDWTGTTQTLRASGAPGVGNWYQNSTLAFVQSGSPIKRYLTSIGGGTSVSIDVVAVAEELI